MLGRDADPNVNGGVVVAYAYGDALPLPNTNVVLTISRDGVIIDAVTSQASFRSPASRSA